MLFEDKIKQAIDDFKDYGIAVVDNVFSDSEVNHIRTDFHDYLKDKFNINHENLFKEDISKIPKFGPHTNIFYPIWKLKPVLDQRYFDIISGVWTETFAKNEGYFKHPFGNFDPSKGYAYLDRVCYRFPDNVLPSGGLELHIDRNPWNPLQLDKKGKMTIRKWRPIQSWIALTDQYGDNKGGLRVVKGFHKMNDNYWLKKPKGSEYGEFIRLKKAYFSDLWSRLETIHCSAGSVVLWDNRLPHATCEKLDGNDTREVLYSTFIPQIDLNKRYAEQQLINMCNGLAPPDFKTTQKNNDNPIDHLTERELQFIM